MKYATSLVCIILLVIFLNACSQGYAPIPEEGQREDNSRTQKAFPSQENYPYSNSQKESIPPKSEYDVDDKLLENQSDITTLNRTRLPLASKVICIDPGHQSTMDQTKVPVAPMETHMMPNFSIGTKGIESGTFEYSITLKVAQKLKQGLIKLGARVILTRGSQDERVGNDRRAGTGNEANADIAISIHCDGIEDPRIYGLTVLFPGDKYIKDQKVLEKSLALSKAILLKTVSATNAKDRGLSKRNNLIVFNYSKIPITLIEMGFLTNPDEDKLLNSDDYQDKLVKGMIEGIQEYFETPAAQVD